MKNFEGLGLSHTLAQSLANMNYTTPTPIQAQAIPLALEGHDIMGTAQTGTGKTAAFAIPLVEKLLNDPSGTALVLTPTRELGKQIMDIMHQLIGPKSPIKTAFIIGGEPYFKQMNQLKNNPRLIVGTPGRINDHLERGTLKLHDTHFLVLDETDRMLDMGFTIQLERIFKFMPAERQTLMFSATMPKDILQMSKKYMSDPKRVEVGETNTVAKNITQEVIRIEQEQKYDELKNQLSQRTGSVIVFIKTKHAADRMAQNLRRDGFTSDALHGDLRQNRRDKVMQNFRKQNFRILIATDIAARGLDVPHIEHVINFDLPQVAEDFIHRMGRTARAGADGSAISFVSRQDGRKWHAIERLLNPNAANDRGNDFGSESNSRRRSSGGKKPFGRNAGGKSFGGKFEGRSSGEGKSFGEKKYGAKPSGESKSFGEKKYGAKPSGEGKSFGEKKYGAKPSGEGKSFGEKKYGAKPSGEGKSFGEKKYGAKPSGEGKSFGEKKYGAKPSGEGKSFGEKKYGAKPSGEGKSFGEKKWAGKPSGERKSFGEKKWAGKPSGEGKSLGEKKWAGKASSESKPTGGKFEGKKKPFAGKSDGGPKRFYRAKQNAA